MMTYAFFFNPGQMQMFLMMAALYGIGGAFPGSDDLNEVLAALGRRMFGQDWDVHKHARRMVRDITRGTVLDEVGPDLAMHGLSRFGFGLGLLPEGWGVPRFDASANGSLGRLIPGVYEAARNWGNYGRSDQFVSDVVTRLSGAGFGPGFNLLQWGMENPGTVASHRWESLLPRAVRGFRKAQRLYTEEGETASSGARVVRYNPSDHDDLATIVGQALGATPTRSSAYWEMTRATREELQVYNARRQALYAQAAYAQMQGYGMSDVVAAVQRYNAEVRELDPSMQIVDLQRSIQTRARLRALQEQGLSAQRNQIPVSRRIQDMFPNVRPERVR